MEKDNEMYIVFSDRIAKYLAKNGIYWHEMRRDRTGKRLSVFAYTEDKETIEKLIKKYKEENN